MGTTPLDSKCFYSSSDTVSFQYVYTLLKKTERLALQLLLIVKSVGLIIYHVVFYKS